MPHQIKRVQLPSGKTIEIVYYRDGQVSAPATADPNRGPELLHICRVCGCDMVYPVTWQEAGPEDWSVLLSCPNCRAERGGVFSQDEVELFDEVLDQGADALARDYKRLMRANMALEADRFAAALAADAILPEDF